VEECAISQSGDRETRCRFHQTWFDKRKDAGPQCSAKFAVQFNQQKFKPNFWNSLNAVRCLPNLCAEKSFSSCVQEKALCAS